MFIPVHLCDRGNNGGCDQICREDGDEAVCECNAGYVSAADKLSCLKSKSINIFCKGLYKVLHLFRKMFKRSKD